MALTGEAACKSVVKTYFPFSQEMQKNHHFECRPRALARLPLRVRVRHAFYAALPGVSLRLRQ